MFFFILFSLSLSSSFGGSLVKVGRLFFTSLKCTFSGEFFCGLPHFFGLVFVYLGRLFVL